MFRTAFVDEKLLMPRTFAYLRASTASQTTDDQLQEIAAVGFTVALH